MPPDTPPTVPPADHFAKRVYFWSGVVLTTLSLGLYLYDRDNLYINLEIPFFGAGLVLIAVALSLRQTFWHVVLACIKVAVLGVFLGYLTLVMGVALS